MSKLRIYMASSWRNETEVKSFAHLLKQLKFDVDCFCDQDMGRTGFNIADELHYAGHNIYDVDAISALEHPAVKDKFDIAFKEDKKWLDWCNCCIMLMPCGRSAHLEGGYAKGQNKLLYIYWLYDLPLGEFDNMYQFADGLYRPDQLTPFLSELTRQEERITNDIET